jgi:hypothetical protein
MPVVKINNQTVYLRSFSDPLRDSTVPNCGYSQNVVFGASFLQDTLLYSDPITLEQLQKQLIRRWRSMSVNHYIAAAIDDICSEMNAVSENDESPIDIDLSQTGFSEKIQGKIHDEFKNLLKFLKYRKRGYYMLRQWIIDGMAHFYIEVDEDKKDINSITMLDPLRVIIYNVKEDPQKQVSEIKKKFQYCDILNVQQIIIDADADNLVTINSGVMDRFNKVWVSILDQAFIPLNQLTALENSLIIYRLARSPERRIFYVDVGELPKAKAEAYIKELIANYRNSMEIDPETGSVKETGRHLAMTDDIWLPRSNSKGTEVSTLPGLQNLGEITDVEMFREKLFRSLHVPLSRFMSQPVGWVNRSPEITRDEVKYAKFISRMRIQFSELFYVLLRKILVVKNIVSQEEFDAVSEDIDFIWSTDNLFNKFKELDVLGEKFNAMERANNFLGKTLSIAWVQKNILNFTDEEIKEIEKEIAAEKAAETYTDFADQGEPPFGADSSPDPLPTSAG